MKMHLLAGVLLGAVGLLLPAHQSNAAGKHKHKHGPAVKKNMPHGGGHGHTKDHAKGHHHDGDPHASGAGVPGDPKMPARVVSVIMSEKDGKMLYSPDLITVRVGEQIRFKIKNVGVLEHEFVIGTHKEIMEHHKLMQRFPDMEHEDPQSIRVKEKHSGEILWRFTKTGKFEFACLIPGHMEAGMKGKFIVKAAPTN